MHCFDALVFCREAHKGQVDKAGEPYWAHPVAVACLLDQPDDELIQIALLHDVIEDTQHDARSLKEAGFSERVVAGVVALSKPPNQEYSAWISWLKSCGNQDAVVVKRADLAHNMDPERVAALGHAQAKIFMLKYESALAMLA